MTRRARGEWLFELTGVTRVYGSRSGAVHALRGIDLCIESGEFVAVTGPSGCGKSTLLHLLGCLDAPSSGSIRFRGTDVGALSMRRATLLRRRLGFVFQDFNLLPRISALENVELPLVYQRVPMDERRRRALRALHAVGLDGREHHRPAELSGGQQQRVALARAVVTRPAALLADEPTGNLDSACSQQILALLSRLHSQRGLAIVMVTHDPQAADRAERIVRMRDGRVDEDVPRLDVA